MEKRSSLIKNTVVIAVGKIFTQFLSFLLLPLYTAYLSASAYGSVDLIMTAIALLTPLITLSLEMAAFRFLIDSRGDELTKRRIISSVARIVGSATLIFITIFTFINIFATIPYGWLAVSTVVATISANMLLQIVRGLGDNIRYSIASVIAGATTILANILFIVWLGMGAQGILLAVILGNIACATYLFISQKIYKYISVSIRDVKLERMLMRYSIPLIPNGVSWWLLNAADRTIIAIALGVASNGIYAIAYKFPSILSSVFSFFAMSWTESASMNIDTKDRDAYFSQTMNAAVKFFGSAVVLIVSVIPLIFSWFINVTYDESYSYIPPLILGSFMNSVVQMYGAIYIAKKMTRQVMSSTVVSALISLLITICLIQWLGLFAPALAMVFAYGAMVIYRHLDVKKYVKITYDYKSFAILALAFIVVSSLYYANNPSLNILNMLVAMAVSVNLNRSIITIIKTKLFARLRPLTPDQQILEEIEEKKL